MMALNIARRIGADVLMAMQNLDIVHGRPSWRAQFLIGTVNTCGRFSALRYEWFGERGKDSWGCRAWAVELSTGEKLLGPDIDIALAKAEGWSEKKGSKWKTMPQLMLMYRAGAWWTRAYAPELSLGFQTAEETTDIIDVTGREVQADDVLKRAAAQLGAPPAEAIPDAEVIDAETGEISDKPAHAVEPPLVRAARLLKMCRTREDVEALRESIAEELPDDAEKAALYDLCKQRAKEI